ncbi:MAG: hypothetical protein Fur0043_02470 [Anaerolineales bacterium]
MFNNRARNMFKAVISRVVPLLNADRLYVVIFEKDTLSFPLLWEGGGFSPEAEAWSARPLEGDRWSVDRVIRDKEPLLFERDVAAEAAQAGIKIWPQESKALSWLGMPLLAGEEALGAIVAENWQQGKAFGEAGKRFLGLAARQAALALENMRLYEQWLEEQKRTIEIQKVTVMSQVAGEFVHRMNNLAGTIPVRVNLARALLNPADTRDEKILKQLDKIAADAQELLRAAQEIKEKSTLRAPEKVNVNELLEIAWQRSLRSLPDAEGKISLERDLAPHLPEIEIERNELLDTFTNIIKNALEAMPEGGKLTLETCLARDGRQIEVIFSDSGKGIPPENLPKIFDLFFTTKEQGMGFGLWKDKAFLKRIGGDIDVHSVVGQGSTFTIQIPVRESHD